MGTFGPRQQRLVEAWAATIETSAQGRHYDFTQPTRTARLRDAVEAFIDDPRDKTFGAFWTPEVLRNATYGGPGLVLNNWEGPLDELVALVEAIRTADVYDPAWERRVPTAAVAGIRELYGRLDPANRPILTSWVEQALPTFGFERPLTYEDGVVQLERFQAAYLEAVGHVTAGTDHEVPISDELEQFCFVVETLDESGLREMLDISDSAHDSFSG